ncbi:MAG: glycosyltransferase [Vicinamibacterales bacterium]
MLWRVLQREVQLRVYWLQRQAVLSRQIIRSQGVRSWMRRVRRRTARHSRPPAAPLFRLAEQWAPLALDTSPSPDVSIVIPAHNGSLYTYTCLRSLAGGTGVAHEVIVVDDQATDDTPAMLAAVAGARVVRNAGARGFVHACNLGARHARGRVLVFLNNDTVCRPGWLQALRETLDADPRAGVVGARLLFADGSLQEAGGVVWRDGSAGNIGRHADPATPGFNYLREVDYCSAACLAIRRELFRDLGGFDTAFAPAYYEDVDLCFRVRAAGYRVLVQPAASVVHFEGSSVGRPGLAGLKRYQLLHQRRFRERWREMLASHPVNGSPASTRANRARPRVLVIGASPDGERPSEAARLVDGLADLVRQGGRAVVAAADLAATVPHADALQRRGIEVLSAPSTRSVEHHLLDAELPYDVVLLGRHATAVAHLPTVARVMPGARVVFDAAALDALGHARAPVA